MRSAEVIIEKIIVMKGKHNRTHNRNQRQIKY